MKKIILGIIIILCSLNVMAKKSKNVVKPVQLMVCQIGSSKYDPSERLSNQNYVDDLFLCHFNNNYYTAETDKELTELIEKSGFKIVKVQKGNFVSGQRTLILHLQ